MLDGSKQFKQLCSISIFMDSSVSVTSVKLMDGSSYYLFILFSSCLPFIGQASTSVVLPV